LLGLGVESAMQYRRINKNRLLIRGRLPVNEDHHQLLSEIGIVKELNATSSKPLPYSREKQHLFSFKSIRKSEPSPHSEDDKTLASEGLAEHVNECIRDHKLELTDEANIALMKSVSEVLDNAERHSRTTEGRQGHTWFMRGYLNSHSEAQNFEISIFNFGMTIAESFLTLPEENYSRKMVLNYAASHEGTFKQEQLVTVAALQQRVSCKNSSPSETNGQGTVVLIQFFEEFCSEFNEKFGRSEVKPMMSIVTGNTHIVFDGTYKLSQVTDDLKLEGDEQLIIAFNDENSLQSPPDPKSVRWMGKSFFPGVAISIRFPLNEEVENGK